jgi:hypothetical protein
MITSGSQLLNNLQRIKEFRSKPLGLSRLRDQIV